MNMSYASYTIFDNGLSIAIGYNIFPWVNIRLEKETIIMTSHCEQRVLRDFPKDILNRMFDAGEVLMVGFGPTGPVDERVFRWGAVDHA